MGHDDADEKVADLFMVFLRLQEGMRIVQVWQQADWLVCEHHLERRRPPSDKLGQ